MRKNLAAGGLVLFDVNSSSTYATCYSGDREVECKDLRWIWRGRGEVATSIFEAEIQGDRLEEPIRHLERFLLRGRGSDALQRQSGCPGVQSVSGCGLIADARCLGTRISAVPARFHITTGRAAISLSYHGSPASPRIGSRAPPDRAPAWLCEPCGGTVQSGRQDLNLRPSGPQPDALPGYATPRGVANLSRSQRLRR